MEIKKDTPLYGISVAAKLVGVHPRTLRLYEEAGLICPARTKGNTRLYSVEDIERLRYICYLTREKGVNLAGVKLLLELEMKRAYQEEGKRQKV